MAEKHYANDYVKAKSRDLVRNMIDSTLLQFRNPSELKVICFPGIDATEIHEVYDPLGIQRYNITGVERDPAVADAILRKGLGITVVRSTIEEYVQKIGKHTFDVISLDYLGPCRATQLGTLQLLLQGQERDHVVLHVANLLRRDHQSFPFYFYGNALTESSTPLERKGTLPTPEFFSNGIYTRVKDLLRKRVDGEKFTAEKQMGYSTIIRACYTGGTIGACNKFLRFAAGREYEQLLRLVERTLKPLNLPPFDRNSPFATHQHSTLYPIVQNRLEDIIHQSIVTDCQHHQIYDPAIQQVIWIMLGSVAKERKVYQAKAAACYSYISETGAPMIGDIYYLSHPRKLNALCQELGRLVNFPHHFRIRNADLDKVYKIVADFNKETVKFSPADQIKRIGEAVENRVFLGNSYRPSLTKERAIAEFERGATVPELRQKYRNANQFPLPQIKAHVTMGTYSTERKTKKVQEDDTTPGQLTKEEVLDLLTSNIPIGEIIAAFPDSFTPGQLRAYKAHLTMKTYEK